MYRANEGNGQVGPTRRTAKEARADLVDIDGNVNAFGWVERYHHGTADDPGDWFRVRTAA